MVEKRQCSPQQGLGAGGTRDWNQWEKQRALKTPSKIKKNLSFWLLMKKKNFSWRVYLYLFRKHSLITLPVFQPCLTSHPRQHRYRQARPPHMGATKYNHGLVLVSYRAAPEADGKFAQGHLSSFVKMCLWLIFCSLVFFQSLPGLKPATPLKISTWISRPCCQCRLARKSHESLEERGKSNNVLLLLSNSTSQYYTHTVLPSKPQASTAMPRFLVWISPRYTGTVGFWPMKHDTMSVPPG